MKSPRYLREAQNPTYRSAGDIELPGDRHSITKSSTAYPSPTEVFTHIHRRSLDNFITCSPLAIATLPASNIQASSSSFWPAYPLDLRAARELPRLHAHAGGFTPQTAPLLHRGGAWWSSDACANRKIDCAAPRCARPRMGPFGAARLRLSIGACLWCRERPVLYDGSANAVRGGDE